MKKLACAAWLCVTTACGTAAAPASKAADVVVDVDVASVDAAVAAEVAVGVDAAIGCDPACELAQVQAALAADQRKTARTIAHLHGPYSKDACDAKGIFGDKPNPTCLASLRAGICASALDVVFLTDHPTHMKDYTFPALLYHAATDTLVQDGLGRPYANVLHCPAADSVPAHDVTLLVGYEGEHTMPIGMHAHLSFKDLYKVVLDNATPFDQAKKVVDEVHAREGLVALVHAEQKAVSPERVRDLGIDLIEIYNIHANFILGYLADFGRLFEFNAFMGPADQAADPNLAIVAALQYLPDEGLNQWHLALRYKRIGGVLGSDAHENVELPALCGEFGMIDDVCKAKAASAPHAVAAFTKGGQILLADGYRFDQFRRMLRWYSTRVRLKPGESRPLHVAVQEALQLGASYQVWNVFGEPDSVQLVAMGTGPKGTAHAGQGEALPADVTAGRRLLFRLPKAVAEPWSPFATANAALAAREVKLWRVTADGPNVVATWNDKGHQGLQVQADVAWVNDPPAGRYHLEVRILPDYLAGPLKNAAALAKNWYRWVISGVVEVP